jgi:hypothetical protein
MAKSFMGSNSLKGFGSAGELDFCRRPIISKIELPSSSTSATRAGQIHPSQGGAALNSRGGAAENERERLGFGL